MPDIFPQNSDLNRSLHTKPVAIWLLIGVGMLIIQILLGGVTRLTGSGLSITEWDVVTGALPPLNEQQWFVEFNKYKQTPQFHILNSDFTLQDFKSIFFLGMVPSFLGKINGCCVCDPFYHFSYSKKV